MILYKSFHFSESNKKCIFWSELNLNYKVPNNLFDRNFCRISSDFLPKFGAPDTPWCFTNASLDTDPAHWEWESCDIPVCGIDCKRGIYDKDSQKLPNCRLIPEYSPER